jgi:hypothetical protein
MQEFLFHDLQGVYYYFYQIFRSEAEARARRSKKSNDEDGSVGMWTSLIVAALAGSEFSFFLPYQRLHLV